MQSAPGPDGLVLQAVIPTAWSGIPAADRELVRARFEAESTSQALRLQAARRGQDQSVDEADPVLERLEEIRAQLEELKAMLQSAAHRRGSLVPVWATLWPGGMQLRLGPGDPDPPSRGALLILRFELPNLPGLSLVGLAEVTDAQKVADGWVEVCLTFESIGPDVVDEIERAAFLAQRLAPAHGATRQVEPTGTPEG